MKIQPTQVHCLKCKHEWSTDLVVAAPIQVFVESIRIIRCPECGAGTKQIVFVTKGELGDEHRVNWSSPERQP